jgi:hypothetical protein
VNEGGGKVSPSPGQWLLKWGRTRGMEGFPHLLSSKRGEQFNEGRGAWRGSLASKGR